MKIGIDIDDTLTNTKKVFSKKLKKYRKKNHLNPDNELSKEDFSKFIKEYGKDIYFHVKEKKQAIGVIRKWIQNNHEIYFITARSNQDVPNIEAYTETYLKKRKIKYQRIIFNAKNKYDASKELHLDVYIDDQERMLDTFPVKDVYLLRMVPSKKIYSKHEKVTNWKEIKHIVKKLNL